jgi:hypothetical protein
MREQWEPKELVLVRAEGLERGEANAAEGGKDEDEGYGFGNDSRWTAGGRGEFQ